jgi:GTP-binding protein
MAFEEAFSNLWARPCVFVKSCPTLETLPPLSFPEVAFVGRSNVGKSTLINALNQQKGLAKASSTPGRTQLLNFFLLKDQYYLVDMPGYGYAAAPKHLVDAWNVLIRNYLRGRSTLRRVYLLIDSRHGLKKNDLEMMTLLDEAAVSYQLVLTKGDKLSEPGLKKMQEEVTKRSQGHGAAYPEILATSAVKAYGLKELQRAIAKVLESGQS